MKPYKATRTETIPNSVFVYAREVLVPHLGPIFRATDTLKIYPDDWKLTDSEETRQARLYGSGSVEAHSSI
jgi:hypothetical protein